MKQHHLQAATRGNLWAARPVLDSADPDLGPWDAEVHADQAAYAREVLDELLYGCMSRRLPASGQ